MRNRQYLGCLRVRGKGLTLEQMHFADEVNPPANIIPNRLPSAAGNELKIALNLISAFSGKWQPEKYKDTYTAGLRKLVRAKVQGKEVHQVTPSEDEPPPDLMDALRASVEQMQGSRRSARRRTTRKVAAKRQTKRAVARDAD